MTLFLLLTITWETLKNTTAFSELTPIKELYQKWFFWTIWI